MTLNRITYHLPLVFNALGQDEKVLEEPPLGFGTLSRTYRTFETKTSLPAFHTEEFLGLGFNFGAPFHYQVNGVTGTIRSNQFNLVYIPACACECSVEKGTHFLFMMRFTPSYLRLLENYFPSQVKDLLSHADQNTLFALSLDHFKCDGEIILKTKELLETSIPAGVCRDAYLNSKVFDILLYCLEKLKHLALADNTGLPTRELQKVEKAKKYLRNNYQHRLSADLVADHVGTDRHKLQKDFKKAYKITMMEFMIGIRMEKAVALLRDTKMRIGDIAEMVGYRPEHFSDVFKKRFGYSPKNLRNQGIADEQNF